MLNTLSRTLFGINLAVFKRLSSRSIRTIRSLPELLLLLDFLRCSRNHGPLHLTTERLLDLLTFSHKLASCEEKIYRIQRHVGSFRIKQPDDDGVDEVQRRQDEAEPKSMLSRPTSVTSTTRKFPAKSAAATRAAPLARISRGRILGCESHVRVSVPRTK